MRFASDANAGLYKVKSESSGQVSEPKPFVS